MTGKTVGRFAIRARLGAGGMGEVYRAEDTRLKRPVALKRMAPQLKADQNYRQRFLREAQYASGLTNQNVAGVYDVLEENDEIFLVMEYVEGRTLRQRLAEPLGIQELLAIAVQCAGALAAAHERGIVHHDIKPDNIMLTAGGEVKILDFGVAKRLPRADDPTTLDTTSSAKSFSGTLAYMAPEALLQKEPDQRADIFSLGVVLYEALSGRQPFLADNFLATSDRVLHEIPAPLRRFNSKVPAELERIVAKMLAKDPAERYSTAADLLVDLRAAQRAMTHPGALPLLAEPRALALRTRWILGAALGIVLIAATGLLFPKLRERWLHTSGTAAPGAVKNLAVLPLEAIGGNPENQAFCDGITETLTATLVRLTATHALQVMPAHELRGRRITTADMARKDLGANLVLEGSMHRFGSTVRVNYALVDARTLQQLRATTITAEASDPFAVQDRVAAAIVSMLELELKPQERQALQAHGTQVTGAYEFYMQGRGYLQNYDKPENVENAITLFQRALGLDPNYVLAHAGLGEAYWKRYLGLKDSQWIEPARRSCERALTLDQRLAAAHICLGTIEDGTGHAEKAAEEFRRALETDPASDDAHRGLGFAYDHLGRLEEAEQTYREAIRLRPNYWAGYSWLGAFYFGHARYKEAEESFKQVVALVPDSFVGYSNLGAMYVRLGRYSDAIQTLERSVTIRPSGRALSNLATAYFYQRRFDEAAGRYEDALKLDDRDYIEWGDLGDAYYWTPGKRPQATAAYQKAATLARQRLQVNARDAVVLATLASYEAMLGERKAALASLQRALEISPDNPDVRFQAALVYNQFGETQRALDWLQKAVAAGYSLSTIQNTPNFGALRSNPDFQALFQGK